MRASAELPRSVALFAQLYAAGIACAFIAGLLSWQAFHERAAVDGPVPGGLAAGLLAGIALSVAVPLALLGLVLRHRSNVARWTAVALTMLGAAALAWVTARTGRLPGLVGAFDAARILFESAGLALTFRVEAQRWLRTKGELP